MQAQLQAAETWPPELIRRRQFEQLAGLLAHADGFVPLQRKRLRAAGYRGADTDIEALWPDLPILTRAELQAAGDDAFATALPAGHGRRGGGATSGSTGVPLRLHKTELSQFMSEAQNLRLQIWHDLDFTATLAGVQHDPAHISPYPDGFSAEHWGAHAGTAFATGAAHRLDIPTPVAEQVEWLGRIRPAYLVSFPSNLAGLARHCRDHGVAWPWARSLFTRGEVVDPAFRGLCNATWGVPVVDTYSAEEGGLLALQCPETTHYHVAAENVLLEVLDETGDACAPGETGRVVITPLHNFAMPLIRYALGDYAALGSGCACGRNLPTLTRILGRSRARLLLPSGERRFPVNPDEAFAAHSDIVQYQIVQRSPELVEVLLVARNPLDTAAEMQLSASLARAFGHSFPLRFTYVDVISRGADGKFHDISCDIVETD